FWPFHDALFAAQAQWASLIDPVDTLVALAADQGLSTAELGACLRTGKFGDVVESAYQAASQGLLLTGTPTVFLNGLKVGDYSEPESYLRLRRLSDALEVPWDASPRAGRHGFPRPVCALISYSGDTKYLAWQEAWRALRTARG